jgi:hypothetical protein
MFVVSAFQLRDGGHDVNSLNGERIKPAFVERDKQTMIDHQETRQTGIKTS